MTYCASQEACFYLRRRLEPTPNGTNNKLEFSCISKLNSAKKNKYEKYNILIALFSIMLLFACNSNGKTSKRDDKSLTKEEFKKGFADVLATVYCGELDYVKISQKLYPNGRYNIELKPTTNNDLLIRKQTSAIMGCFEDIMMIEPWSAMNDGCLIAHYVFDREKLLITFFINTRDRENYTLSIGLVGKDD